MKLKLLRQLYFMSRLAFFCIIIQMTLCGILVAEKTNAQLKGKSLEEIRWNKKISATNLFQVMEEIQKETGFVFAYNENLIDKEQKINLDFRRGSLGDLLRVISKESSLKFKRINDQIHVATNKSRGQSVEDQSVQSDIDISGKITDENGEGLPGASVIVKGTQSGTTTDLSGNYKLSVPEDAILTISFVGYKTAELEIAGRSTIDIQMEL
ncbi:MAG: carboxypeptidase-like regulatory domain-containing protein, partial [Cyclobacteriaceae bacterium]